MALEHIQPNSKVGITSGQLVLSHGELLAHVRSASPEVQAAIIQHLAVSTDKSNAAVAAQATQVLGAQLGTQQLKALGQTTVEQQKAAETVVELTAYAQQAAAQGRSEAQITGELAGKGASATVAKSFAQHGVQEQQQEQRKEQLAGERAQDEEHRVKVGLAESHPMAHLVPDHLKVAIGAAMGGAQQAQNDGPSGPASGKSGPEGSRGGRV